jgi:hypothetical protein
MVLRSDLALKRAWRLRLASVCRRCVKRCVKNYD